MRKATHVCTSQVFALIIIICISSAPSVAELSTEALGSGLGRFNSIKVFDINGDGNKEIIFGNYEGYVHILKYQNNEWTLKKKSDDLGDRLWGVAVGDVASDGDVEIVVGNGDGYVYVMDAFTISIKWKSWDLGSDAHGIAIADVDSDAVTDIIVGTGFRTGNGYLYVFNGKNYTLKWKSGPWESKLRGIAVGDLDSDGVTEIVVGSGIGVGEGAGEGYIRIFNGQNGTLKWKSDNLGGDVEAIEISDVDSDGTMEIIAGTGYKFNPGYVYIIDGKTHAIEWKSWDIGPKAFGLAVGDIDADGTIEIVVGNQVGYVYIFDGKTHALEWKSDVLGNDAFGICIADIYSDGTVYIVVCTNGYVSTGTSAYTLNHIYFIDGKTHALYEITEPFNYEDWLIKALILFFVLVMLIELNILAKSRKQKKAKLTGEKGGTVWKKS